MTYAGGLRTIANNTPLFPLRLDMQGLNSTKRPQVLQFTTSGLKADGVPVKSLDWDIGEKMYAIKWECGL